MRIAAQNLSVHSAMSIKKGDIVAYDDRTWVVTALFGDEVTIREQDGKHFQHVKVDDVTVEADDGE